MALSVLTLEIPAGQALSAPLEIPANLRAVRIGMPDAWDPAVPISFQISPDNSAYRDLFHAAQTHDGPWMLYEVSTQVIPNTSMLMPLPDMGASIGWLKIRSGTRAKLPSRLMRSCL